MNQGCFEVPYTKTVQGIWDQNLGTHEGTYYLKGFGSIESGAGCWVRGRVHSMASCLLRFKAPGWKYLLLCLRMRWLLILQSL